MRSVIMLRTRPFQNSRRYVSTNGTSRTQLYPLNGIAESIMEVKSGRFTNVSHYKTITYGSGYKGWANYHFYVDGLACPPPNFSQINSAISEARSTLPVDLSPTAFEIIPFLADWDSTLGMVGNSIARMLNPKALIKRNSKFVDPFNKVRNTTGASYGELTWGWSPLVSDMKNLVGSLKALSSKTTPQCWKATRKRPFSFERSPEAISLAATPDETAYLIWLVGEIAFRGTFTFIPPNLNSPINKILRLLDVVGFHPDLKTAYDVIPLSFVLDYFLPIGDLLDSLHPRGWLLPSLTFEGFETINYLYSADTFHRNVNYQPIHALRQCSTPPVGRFYSRLYHPSTSFNSLVTSPPKWSSPSFKELFNTAYLATNLKKVF